MSKVLGVFFGIEKIYAVIFCLSVAFLYTMLSGLWGVVVTDFLQYIFAVAGTLILAYVVINSQQIGGFDSFVTKINNIDPEHLKFFVTSCESCDTTGFFSSSFLADLEFFFSFGLKELISVFSRIFNLFGRCFLRLILGFLKCLF